MLEPRIYTFLTLCRLGNYTRTAEELHITQPAVTQHIQYLEEQYGSKLITYSGKNMVLTPQGELLRRHAAAMQADAIHLQTLLQNFEDSAAAVVFGATRTIGEYTMPPIMARLMTLEPGCHITMLVDNTYNLLKMLDSGEIQFALVEGIFDKSRYDSIPFSSEEYVAVAAADSPLCHKEVRLEDLLGYRLLLREPGSGSRDILEHILSEHNLGVQSFASVSVLGSISAIKELTRRGLGITFLYRAAAEQELKNGTLGKIELQDFKAAHDFSFVFVQGSRHSQEYLSWAQTFAKLR